MFQLRRFLVFSVLLSSYSVQTQVVNLALKKTTNSTQFSSYEPSLAVDGRLSQKFENCGHTVFEPVQTVAWWQVDLTHTAEIKNITIYYRETTIRRLNGFQITVGMRSIWQDEQPCYNDTEPGYPPSITTISTCTGPGRYVTIFNYQYDIKDKDYGPILHLCEVQVFEKGCYRGDGRCFKSGCEAGWLGNSCNKSCVGNTYGQDCAFTCYCQKGPCNHITGVCIISGCKAGWKGDSCSTRCFENTYGQECALTCYCQEGTCDHMTGVCIKPGCKAGWKGDSCSTRCDESNFGSDCKFTCHCLNGSCDRSTGVCDDLGCKAGWKGESCSTPCDKDFFGSNCSSKCFCRSDTCDQMSGKCNGDMCKDGWTGETCSKKTDNMSLQIGVLVGGLGLIFTAMMITIYVCRRRRSRKKKNNVVLSETKPDIALDHVYDELGSPDNTDYAVIGTDVIKETTYVNNTSDSTILSMENFRDGIMEKIKNGILQKQHKNIPYGPLYPQTAGNLSKNKKKNRNRNVIPYDNSRVILDSSDQGHDDDYINASYINGITKDSMYIAAQGPMKNTFEDFWRMVWQTKCSVVVMLTNVTEDKQETCFQYWPGSLSVLAFREYEIFLLEEHTMSEFSTRKLKVKNTKTGEIRKVWHLQFTSWPRQSVPNPYQLFILYQKYTEIISTNPSGPAIIHCSDGSERSGIFIAFDVMVKCYYRNEEMDICMVVSEMRKKRMNMVATEESYTLLHKLLFENIQYQENHVAKNDFRAAMQERGDIQSSEYEMLVNNLPKYDHTFYKEAMLKKNRAKHRNQSILPVETYRVVLNKTQYINAVEVPSCRMSKQFLVTQIPLIHTKVDLWRMIFDNNSGTVVNLEEAPDFEEDLIWHPKDENILILGNFLLTKTSDIMTDGTRETSLKVSDKENRQEKFVKLFQYLNWRPGNVTPVPQTSFLDFIHLVLTWNKSINNAPVTVICSDGAKCCGLFCLVYSVIENLTYSDDIDIFQIARLQQIRRPQFFSMEQYHFCYNIVQEYLEKVQLYNDIE